MREGEAFSWRAFLSKHLHAQDCQGVYGILKGQLNPIYGNKNNFSLENVKYFFGFFYPEFAYGRKSHYILWRPKTRALEDNESAVRCEIACEGR